MFQFPQRHSRAPPPLPSPAGVKVLLDWYSASRRGEGGTELCCFNFGLNSAFQTISFTAMSCLNGWTLLSRFCVMPLKKKNPSRNHWKWTTWREGNKAWDFVSCIAVGYTCNSADRCVSLNHCFHLKPLHLAPNFCWRYTMGYLNIFLCTHKIITHKQLKNPIGTKLTLFFKTFSMILPHSYISVIIHKRTKPTKLGFQNNCRQLLNTAPW